MSSDVDDRAATYFSRGPLCARRLRASSPRCRPSADRGPSRRRPTPWRRRSAWSPRRWHARRETSSIQPSRSMSRSRPDLKMPEPTKTPSAPSCMQSDASAGVAMPPAVNVTTGRRPFSATQRTSNGCPVLLRRGKQLVVAGGLKPTDGAEHGAHVRNGVHDVAGARFTLRSDHRGAFGDPAQCFAEIRRPPNERNREPPLVDVVRHIRGCEYLGLIDVVDLELLQDLRLGEVTDTALRHHRRSTLRPGSP